MPPVAIPVLEDIAARAWPAARTDAIGGWRLYAATGFSGRINSCWPLETPGVPLPDAVAKVEAWYAVLRLPPLFKIVESACAPDGLTDHLAALGYRPRTETVMMIGEAAGGADADIGLVEEVSEAFAAVFSATASNPGDGAERLATLARISGPRAFALAEAAGEPAAIGACAIEGDWAGVFAMRTDPRMRRQGLARRVLGALLARAAAFGARHAWLQVEADNAGAIALYERAGFVEAYRYRYWGRA